MEPPAAMEGAGGPSVPEGSIPVAAPIAGSVWKIVADVGATVRAGDALIIVEAMKTEIAVVATTGGTVGGVLVAVGSSVTPGQVVAFLDATT